MAKTRVAPSHFRGDTIRDLLSIDLGTRCGPLFKYFVVVVAFVQCLFLEFGIPGTPVTPSCSINRLNIVSRPMKSSQSGGRVLK